MLEAQSSVRIQRPGTTSLRTTVPASIVQVLNVGDKDKLSWKVILEDGKPKVIVEKKEE